MTLSPAYLEGAAQSAAAEWLNAHGLHADRADAATLIEENYPGGLHFFIAEHLVSPPETTSNDEGEQPTQPALF